MCEQVSLPAVAHSACNADPCRSYGTALELVLHLNACFELALAGKLITQHGVIPVADWLTCLPHDESIGL